MTRHAASCPRSCNASRPAFHGEFRAAAGRLAPNGTYFDTRSLANGGGAARATRHFTASRMVSSLRITVALAVWLTIAGGPLAATTAFATEDVLERALKTYEQGMGLTDRDARLDKFSTAYSLFTQVIEQQLERGQQPSAALWSNLGNAALQAQHIGEANLAFQRALALDPGNSRAAQNLAYARALLPEWARQDEVKQVVETLFIWKQYYSSESIAVLAAVSFLIAMLLVSFSIARRQTIWRNLSILPFLIFLFLQLSLFVGGRKSDAAVITQADTVLYSADSENSAPRISQPLPDGTEVELLQRRDRWTEVKFSGRTGWVRSSAIEPVLLESVYSEGV